MPASKLDRLGRSLPHLIEAVHDLEQRRVGFRSLTDNIDTTTASGRMFFNMMGALSQFERDLILERTNAGLKAARERGNVGGRPRKLTDADLKFARSLMHRAVPRRGGDVGIRGPASLAATTNPSGQIAPSIGTPAGLPKKGLGILRCEGTSDARTRDEC